jgi:hypothetical protein
MRNKSDLAAFRPIFAIWLEIQAARPEAYVVLAVADMIPSEQLPQRRPAVGPFDEVDLTMLRFSVGRVDDREFAGSQVGRTIVVGDQVQDASGWDSVKRGKSANWLRGCSPMLRRERCRRRESRGAAPRPRASPQLASTIAHFFNRNPVIKNIY